MFTTLSVIGIMLLGQIIKGYILPKWGNYGFYAVLFVVALVVNGVHMAMTIYPGFGDLVFQAGKFLIATIGVYELLIDKLKNVNVNA